jgi:hypothetical protein
VCAIALVSLFIRAPDLSFLKPLYSKARFFVFEPVRKIRDTNKILLFFFSPSPKRVRPPYDTFSNQGNSCLAKLSWNPFKNHIVN